MFTNLIPHIRMVDVCAKWDSTQSENVLDGINMYLIPGKVYLLTGAVGAGKVFLHITTLPFLKWNLGF